MRHLLLALIIITTLAACSQLTDLPQDDLQSTIKRSSYAVDIRWTSYGIPHVKAEDWASLGYGFAYATATDAVCVIAKDMAMVNGELSANFGSEKGNLASDIFHKALLTEAKLTEFVAAQSPRALAMDKGYAAGYNRYIRDHRDSLPASCAGAAWVKPISERDIHRLAIGFGIRYGLGQFKQQIADASPNRSPDQLAEAAWRLPVGLGSNAVAVGRDISASGRGMLLGNPHYPWHGSSRFHLIHVTIPGEVDVMGTSLLSTNRVAIGFNKDMAWTHTVSTAQRFTLYQLSLNPDNPYEYEYDGEYRPIETRTVDVQVRNAQGELETQQQTARFTHFGPIVASKQFPWTEQVAYALRDAVIDNYHTARTYDALNKATSTNDVEAAISQQGVYWTNTIAADRSGNAFYADISGTPNIDQALLDRCQIKNAKLPKQISLLRGNDSDCEWYDDPESRVAGTLPASKMPHLTRGDYVTNSNDSYWLSNPAAPLEGYSPMIGDEGAARTLRTRAGLAQMEEMLSRGDKLEPEHIQEMLYNQRNYAAEIMLDNVLEICAGSADLAPICNALDQWDRTMNANSQGGHLWREFWRNARSIDGLYAVPFDPNNPVHTPTGIRVDAPQVTSAVTAALKDAAERLTEAGIALNARLGDIQYAERNGERIPIPGGEGWAGMFSMIQTKLLPNKGYAQIMHGNSYIQVISWDKDGNVQPKAMLTYSQSPEPDSPHYSDLTKLYAQLEWIDLPFREEQILADPNLRELRLEE